MARVFCLGIGQVATLRSLVTCAVAGYAATLGLAAADLTTSEEQTLRATRPGEVVRLDAFLKERPALRSVPIQIMDAHGPQFLLSDRPEYFLTGDGIALQEEVKPGVVRLYIYHVPEPTGAPKTISAVVENHGQQSMTLRFLRAAFPKPGTDYQRIAKEALTDFLSSEPEKTSRSVLPGKGIALDPKLDKTTATKDQLVHGFYEFEINQPARITVFQRDPTQGSLSALETLPKLPATLPGKRTGSGAGRGLFLTSDFAVTNEPGFVLDTTNGPMQLIVADGRRDGWIRGRDSLENNEDARDSGNYGVLYRIRLTRASTDGRALALLLCKVTANNQWCGKLAAAVRVSDGVWPGGVVTLPSGQSAFGEPGEAAVIQEFPPLPKGETGTIELIYSPPGAACIPTPLVFVPYQP